MKRIFFVMLPIIIFGFFTMLYAQDDEFNSTNLGSQWSWVRENKSNWFLTGTSLEIRTESGALNGTIQNSSATNSVKNILLQSPPPGTFRFETRLSFNPDTSFQNAGLIYYLDDDNYIRVSRGVFSQTNGVWMEWEVDGKTLMTFVDNVKVASIYLRLSRTNGVIFSATYSVNGTTWNLIDTQTIIFAQSLPAPRIGLQAANGAGVAVPDYPIPARFDYFRFLITPVENNLTSNPQSLKILGVYPNPASRIGSGNSSIQLTYELPSSSKVTIVLVDLLGREVMNFFTGRRDAGIHREEMNVANISQGVYFVRLKTEKESIMRRIVLLQ